MIKKQSGSAVVLAIFVIIVISLLGASLVSLQRDSAQGTSYDVYAARAYFAAYSASEVALMDAFPLKIPGVSAICNDVIEKPSLPNSVGFHGCEVEYLCTPIPASAGIATSYQVISTATCGNSQTHTRRQLIVKAVNL